MWSVKWPRVISPEKEVLIRPITKLCECFTILISKGAVPVCPLFGVMQLPDQTKHLQRCRMETILHPRLRNTTAACSPDFFIVFKQITEIAIYSRGKLTQNLLKFIITQNTANNDIERRKISYLFSLLSQGKTDLIELQLSHLTLQISQTAVLAKTDIFIFSCVSYVRDELALQTEHSTFYNMARLCFLMVLDYFFKIAIQSHFSFLAHRNIPKTDWAGRSCQS